MSALQIKLHSHTAVFSHLVIAETICRIKITQHNNTHDEKHIMKLKPLII